MKCSAAKVILVLLVLLCLCQQFLSLEGTTPSSATSVEESTGIFETTTSLVVTSNHSPGATTMKPASCHSDPCQHGGTCMETDNSYWCLCLDQLILHYTGAHCETAVYTVPTIRDVSPQFGPEAGGTLITLVGNHLAIGNHSVDVYLAELPCMKVSQEDHVVVVSTPKLPNRSALKQKLDIRAVLAGLEVKMDQHFTFEYRGNPVIESVKPLEAIAEGGIQLTVTGALFDWVAQPIMVITEKYTQEKYSSPCTVKTAETMICLSPTVDKSLLEFQRSKRNVQEVPERVEYHISFILDGLEVNFARHIPDYSRLVIIVGPPKMKTWDKVIALKPGETLTIFSEEGEDLRRGCTIDDYRVNIDRGMCRVLELQSNSLQCKTPTNTTGFGEKGDGKGDLRVVMYIGRNYYTVIGHMRYLYESGDSPNTWLLIGGGLAVFLLILAGIITYIVRRKARTCHQREQASYRSRQTAMQRHALDVPPQTNLEDFRRLRATERPKRRNFEGSPKVTHNHLTTRSDYLQIINRNNVPDQSDYLPPTPAARGPSSYYNNSSGFGISTFGSNDWHQHKLQSMQRIVASPLCENTALAECYTGAQNPNIDQHDYEKLRHDDQSMLPFSAADTPGHYMTLGQSRSEIDGAR